MIDPALHSLALRDIPAPDFADVAIVAIPPGVTADPAEWAQTIFDIRSTPWWVIALMGLRQLLVGLIGVSRGGPDVFAVREIVGEEALIATDDRHLDFRVGVGVDAEARLVRVTTAVRFHGWRGRLYFIPVRLVHGPIVQAMTRRAVRRLGAG